MLSKTEELILKLLTENMVIAESIESDYIDKVSSLTGDSIEETTERLNHIKEVSMAKIELRIKDYLGGL